MANWDEDAVTMAFEAGRDCLPAADPAKDRAHVDAIYFASTTLPFADRQNAGIVAGALSLTENISSVDVVSSQRAGTSALIAALDAVKAGRATSPLLVASDKRKARAASAQELAYGDAAAAFMLGSDNTIADFLGSHSLTLDFVDHFRGEGEDFDYGWEERWIRDEGYSKIVPAVVKALLSKLNVAPGDIAHFILPCPFAKLDQTLAKQCGIDPAKVREIHVQTDGFSLHVVKDGDEPGPEAAPEPDAEPESPAPPRAAPRKLVTIAAPMLGIFYAADGPGERPFVEIGGRVQEDTTVAIIEVMKMMNSVPAGVSGTVVEVCAENAAIVEEGAALFRVDPS